MSTAGETECVNRGAEQVCPASATFTISTDEVNTIVAELACPLDSVRQSSFITSSQEGLCTCDAVLDGPSITDAAGFACGCYACPVGTRYGFAYDCNRPIAQACTSYNCNGECNGREGFFPGGLDSATFAPTAAPDSAAYGSTPLGVALLLAIAVTRFIR